ncbi:hypothetical protein [Nonomuraea guangzhouensis]|uniref:MmyB-like transcription regulator ligand binding domain-containing protein n=1 Tax=Nonomuraea guangzhouensis TaxID=1291555 RepID=A0ABW4GQ77_9ACTN|nr:hypothetical protein [Nonomuraea guangzhouensis]
MLPPDADPDGEWRAALTQRYPLVKKFLRLLVETVEFGATADSAKILIAFQSLPDLVDANPTRRVPSGCLDARKVEVDVVPAGWRPLVFKNPRPEGTKVQP